MTDHLLFFWEIILSLNKRKRNRQFFLCENFFAVDNKKLPALHEMKAGAVRYCGIS
ncbi:hypothetical protein B4168_3154 [Anoxybacillus flavithermus]|nr:hypothetical protein B4168_3154 [Anoxybacillus flavithermus]OAO86441.1 hypothetical protein GT23_2334 [Parageobacillus thermoglucosidasius]